MKKAEYRKLALAQRKKLSSTEVSVLTHKLLDHFSKLDFSAVKTIHIFLPIKEKKEPDTFLFIEWLKTNRPEIKIIVPKADFETTLMTNYEYVDKDDLQTNLYSILEPQKATLHSGDVEMIIVPLLVFDNRGYRVGYGKGFYDRFLQNMFTLKVGISLFGPSPDIEDVDGNDIRLDLCITPQKTFTFL